MGVRISGGGGGGAGTNLLPLNNEWTGNNTFDLPLVLGVDGSYNGTLKFWSIAGTGFACTIAPPAGGFSANRSIILPDIGGQIFMVGANSVAEGGSPAAGTIATVNVTGRTTAYSSTNLTNATPAGLYMISTQLACTTVGTGTLSITYTATTDGGSRAISPVTLPLTIGNIQTNTSPIYLSSGNITFVTSFSTVPAGSGTYALRIRCSYLG